MKITFKDMDGAIVACVPIVTDSRGYLYAEHPSLRFEVDCALYLYQDGDISEDVIHDLYTDEPYIQWSIQ